MIMFQAIIVDNLHYFSSQFLKSVADSLQKLDNTVRIMPRAVKIRTSADLNDKIVEENKLPFFLGRTTQTPIVQIVATKLLCNTTASDKLICLAESFFFLQDPIMDINGYPRRRKLIQKV